MFLKTPKLAKKLIHNKNKEERKKCPIPKKTHLKRKNNNLKNVNHIQI
jgi:hypothetical protein